MKNLHLFKLLVSLVVAPLLLTSCTQQAEPQIIENYPVFAAGENSAHSHRIPALVTAGDGSLIAIAEARWVSWVDKTFTDIVARRSTDGGKTWSDIVKITDATSGAYMDPTPIVERKSGEIFLFFSYWPEDDHSTKANQAFLVTSKDNGATWSKPKEITTEIAPGNLKLSGFGPGVGIQMEGGEHAGRMLLPTRYMEWGEDDTREGFIASYYSDDNGATWQIGERINRRSEFQYAESPKGVVVANIRDSKMKWVTRSYDGGVSWQEPVIDKGLPSVEYGCQSSIYGIGDKMWYSGITGRQDDANFDNRADLTLFMSKDGGNNWYKNTLLYDKASGYSCISFLPDGRMAILYEAADTPGFVRDSAPEDRVNWMRMDIMILPKANIE